MPWHSALATRATGYKIVAADWNNDQDNLNYLAEIGYAEVTAPVTANTTTVATAVQLVTLGAITYEAVPTLIEFSCPRVTAGAAQLNIILRDGTTVIGTLATTPTSGWTGPMKLERRLTPTAASHTYNIAAWVGAASTSAFNASTGGAAGDGSTYLPMWIRATRIPT